MKKVCPVCKVEYAGGEVFCPVDAARLVTTSQLDGSSGEFGTSSGDPLLGQVFDKYRVIRRIGEGGMGLVYEAQHTVIEKRVAMKVLRDDYSARTEVVERFRQEAKSASRIGHEHIVDISDFGMTPSGASYFIMEFLEGEDLASVLGREGVVAPERAVGIVSQCCRALGAAHSKGIVHRDMKPENIFLTRREDTQDFVKIVDFGIAKMSDVETSGAPGRKLTKTGMIFGTPEYMSPEQAAGKELDHRVDVYAVGIILYECLCGRVPFIGDTFMGILTQHLFEEPPPLRSLYSKLECSPALEEVVFKAIAKNRDERFPSMEAFADALTAATSGDARGKGTRSGSMRAVVKAPRTDASVVTSTPTIEGSVPKRPSMGVWVAALLGALALSVGSYWALAEPKTVAEAGRPTETLTPVATAPVQVGPAAVAVEDVPTPSPEPVPSAATEVPVRIETEPDMGAEVMLEGTDDTCTTPCELVLAPGEEVVLVATKGRFRGTLTAVVEAGSVLRVPMRRSPANRPRPSAMNAGGDLKIPSIFR